MANTNVSTFSGRLVADPELKQTQSGISVCTFNIANEDGYGEKKKVYYPTFIAWRGHAEFVSKLARGTLVVIKSKYTERKWEKHSKDSSGRETTEKRTAYEFIVETIEAAEPKRAASGENPTEAPAETPSQNQAQQYSYSQNQAANFEEISPEDDLPF